MDPEVVKGYWNELKMYMDLNDDGIITWEEMAEFFQEHGVDPAPYKRVFDELDFNKNGHLDEEDFDILVDKVCA